MIKKTIIAFMLNMLFGGVGYLYLRDERRLFAGVILTLVMVSEFIRRLSQGVGEGSDGNPFAILPMFTFFNNIFGIAILVAMTIDIYFIVKKQHTSTKRLRIQKTKTV